MINLPQVTLIVIDCKNKKRAERALRISSKNISFGAVKLLTSIHVAQPYLGLQQEHAQSTAQDTIFNGITEVIIPPVNSIMEYSRFMIKELHKYVTTEFALCIQWDAFVLNHLAWKDNWLGYDYIGAPWWFNDQANVGNGGFSLRSLRFLRESSNLRIKNYHPEDVVLCRTYRDSLIANGIRFAPETVASSFSIEGNQKYGHIWTNQFGFHDLQQTNISKWSGWSEFKKTLTMDY